MVAVARRTAWGGLDIGTTPFVFIRANPGSPAAISLYDSSSGPAMTRVLPVLYSAIREVEPGLAIRQLGTMQTEIDALLAPQRTAAWLLVSFGVLALVLAAIGIWGVVSQSVAQRRRDLSVRIALGATRGQVVRLATHSMIPPVVLGPVPGTFVARMLTRTSDAFMFGVGGGEPPAYILVVSLLAGTAAPATWLPARRAAVADPVDALRAD